MAMRQPSTQESIPDLSSAKKWSMQNSQQAAATSSNSNAEQSGFTRWEDGVRYMMAGDNGKFKVVHIRSGVDETVTVA